MKNKKAIELAINTFVIIVISLSVLILVLFWFNYQTGFFTKFLQNFRGKSNVDEIVDVCNTLYSSNRVYSYCCDLKKVNAGEEEFELTCDDLREKEFTSARISKLACEEVKCVV